MKERRKIFSAANLAAIRDGRKTMFREMVVKQKHPFGTWATPDEVAHEFNWGTNAFAPPLGTIGDRLWLPEPYAMVLRGGILCAAYKGDPDLPAPRKFKSGALMWRELCRTFAEITGVRVERLQEITEEDAKKEGIVETEAGRVASKAMATYKRQGWSPLVLQFADLWQSSHGNWDANPWVWVYSIKLIKP